MCRFSVRRNIWKTSVWMRPIFQTTCFMRAVGSALGPQIANPFLGQDVQESVLTNITASVSSGNQRPPRVQFAYLIMSALDTIMGIATFTCMTTCSRASIRHERKLQDVGDDKNALIPDNSGRVMDSEDSPTPSSRKCFFDCAHGPVVPRCILATVIFSLFIAYGGMLVLFFLLYTYVYEYLGWSADGGTLLITMSCVVRFVFGVIVVGLQLAFRSSTSLSSTRLLF